MSTPPPSLSLCAVLSESKRIINAHSRHFLALSVLFLLPLSFAIAVSPTLNNLLLSNSLTPNSQIFITSVPDGRDHQPTVPTKVIVVYSVYSLFIFLLSLCAVASISYSVFHGFYGRPVKIFSAIKSVSVSFFRLLITSVLAHVSMLLICVAFGVLAFLAVIGFEILGFNVNYSSPYFIAFSIVFLLVLLFLLVNLQVIWSLYAVISVIESTWGFQPLRRSVYLIRGMRRVAFSLLLLFAFFAGFINWSISAWNLEFDDTGNIWKRGGFVLQIVASTTLLMLILLYNAAANTVLYMYCKAIHGELALEIAEEFARDYVSLPFDEAKVPHLVSIAYT